MDGLVNRPQDSQVQLVWPSREELQAEWPVDDNPLKLPASLDLFDDENAALLEELLSDNCYSDQSPQSSDSGNHSPTSSSSDGINVGHWGLSGFDHVFPLPTEHIPEESLRFTDDNSVFYAEDIKFTQQFDTPSASAQTSATVTPTPVIQSSQYIRATCKSVEQAKAPIKQWPRIQPYPYMRPCEIKQENCSQIVVSQSANFVTPVTVVVANVNNNMLPTLTTASLAPPTPSTKPFDVSQNDDSDDFMKKKEDRKIRNRAAAQLSRQRKRNEFDDLRKKIEDGVKEREVLFQENQTLKRRVEALENENKVLRASCAAVQRFPRGKVVKTAGVSLFALFMFVALPGGPSMSEMSSPSPSALSTIAETSNSAPFVRPGRSLAELNDYNNIVSHVRNISKSDNSTINGKCPYAQTALNASESIRLNNDLINWIDRHDKMNFVQLRNGNNPFLIYNSRKDLFAGRHVPLNSPSRSEHTMTKKAHKTSRTRMTTAEKKEAARVKAIRDRAWRHLDMIGPVQSHSADIPPVGSKPLGILQRQFERSKEIHHGGGSELAVLSQYQPQKKMEDIRQLISSIKQKDDMLYVVAMQDYFLLPAIDKNNTVSPKISIILPALSANTSTPNQITMMRIECQVVGTSIFYLSQALASLFNNSNEFHN
jgi:hypothetical protein